MVGDLRGLVGGLRRADKVVCVCVRGMGADQEEAEVADGEEGTRGKRLIVVRGVSDMVLSVLSASHRGLASFRVARSGAAWAGRLSSLHTYLS